MPNRMGLWCFLVVLAVTLLIPSSQAADLTCIEMVSAVDQYSADLFPGFDEVHNVEYCGTATWYAVDLVSGHGYPIYLQAHMRSGRLNFARCEADVVADFRNPKKADEIRSSGCPLNNISWL